MSLSPLTPYPLIYCPPGVPKPDCCPHVHAIATAPGKGPDAVTETINGQQVTTGGAGTCYGGGYTVGSPGWVKTRAGWWIQIAGRKPQDLIRLQPHPRVQRWSSVVGAKSDHVWQVPVLIEEGQNGWTSALDGVWDGERYTGGDLEPLQQQLLAIVIDATKDIPVEVLMKAMRQLAIDLLRIAQWVDRAGEVMVAGNFLNEALILRTIYAAYGREVT